MRVPSLTSAGPVTFILASDGAFSPFHPENDQVWELKLNGREKFPFSLQTTYGLRARSMRLFPNIIIENKRFNDPRQFSHQPAVTCYTPDSLCVTCSPISSIAIEYTFFTPHSDILVGSVTVKNKTDEQLNLILELAAILVPMGEGFAAHHERLGNTQIIVGQTGDLSPVLLMSGSLTAVNNPYPALSTSPHPQPGMSATYTWVLASKPNREASFHAARRYLSPEWRKVSYTHVIKHAGTTLQVRTGQPDWDAAFYLSQTTALTHVVSRKEHTAQPYFLRSRLPDQPPYSPKEREALDDLTTLEANHLAQVLLPTHTQLIKNLMMNFIKRCDQKSILFSRLNTTDFIHPFREPPILAQLVLEIYQIDRDKGFLSNVLNDLTLLTDGWFQQNKDSGHHNFYTWENLQQLQLDSGLFAFDIWEEAGKGLEIQYAESPALLAMLYRETAAIEKMAEILHQKTIQARFNKRIKLIKAALQACWQDQWNRFTYLDYQSRLNTIGECLYKGKVKQSLSLNKEFNKPRRLQIHLEATDEHTRVCSINIKGKDANGSPIVEKIKPTDVHWVLNTAHVTSRSLYTHIKSAAIKGMKTTDHLRIETADLSQGDVTCLLPIWSGAASKRQLDLMVDTHLNPEDIRNAYGIPETWEEELTLPESLPLRVNVIWNTLIIEGLLREGYNKKAAAFFTTLMSTIVDGLRDFHGFFPYYEAATGKPAGKRNAIAGLVPLALFLKIAGIRLFSPKQVAIWGLCPFPWQMQVQWQGLSLEREGCRTRVTFPNGTIYKTDTAEPVMMTQ